MNQLTFVLSILFLFACSEENIVLQQANSPGVSDSPLVGTWVLAEQKVSIGGPATWQDVDAGDTIRFRADGSFVMTHRDCSPKSYETADDLIKLTYDCPEAARVDSVNYRIVELTDGYLTLTNPRCFEACVYKYARVPGEAR